MNDKEFYEYSNTPEMLKLKADMDAFSRLHPMTFQCKIVPFEPEKEE